MAIENLSVKDTGPTSADSGIINQSNVRGSRPAAIVTRTNTELQYHLFFTTSLGEIFQIWKSPNQPFKAGVVKAQGAPRAVGNPAAMAALGQQHVFYRAISDTGHAYIYHIWRDVDGNFNGEEWTTSGAPEPLGDPSAVVSGPDTDQQQHVFYRAKRDDGSTYIYQIWRNSDASMQGGEWTAPDALQPAGDPSAVAAERQQHVFFRSNIGNQAVIYQIWRNSDGSMQGGVWTADGAPEPLGDPSALLTGFALDVQQHVFYRGSDGLIRQIWRNSDGSMQQGVWTADGAPEPAGDPSAFNFMGRYQAVAYFDREEELYLIFLISGKLTWEWCSYRNQPKNIPLAQMMDLLTKYSPKVWLHPEEKFMPSSVYFAFLHMRRELRETKIGNVYCLRTNQSWVGDVNPPKPPTGFPKYFLGDISTAAVYAFFVDKSGRNTDLTYFFFYPYNRGTGGIGNHVSDWEHVTVRLAWSKSGTVWTDPTPIAVAASAHSSANYEVWDKVEKEGTHPVVYSAKGTHANYFSSGPHTHIEDGVHIPDLCGQGTNWDTWLKQTWAFFWDPSNFPLELNRSYKGTPLNDCFWPGWMSSSKYGDPGTGDPSQPEAGPIYRWGNPFSLVEVIGDSITGPIDKDEVWLPYTFG